MNHTHAWVPHAGALPILTWQQGHVNLPAWDCALMATILGLPWGKCFPVTPRPACSAYQHPPYQTFAPFQGTLPSASSRSPPWPLAASTAAAVAVLLPALLHRHCVASPIPHCPSLPHTHLLPQGQPLSSSANGFVQLLCFFPRSITST